MYAMQLFIPQLGMFATISSKKMNDFFFYHLGLSICLQMKNYPNSSLLSYIQSFELKCGVLEDGMSMLLCTIAGYEPSIVPCIEASHVSPCRSTMLLMSSSEKNRTHSLGEHSNGKLIHEAMEGKMIDGRHLEMRNIFYFLDDTFSMRIS